MAQIGLLKSPWMKYQLHQVLHSLVSSSLFDTTRDGKSDNDNNDQSHSAFLSYPSWMSSFGISTAKHTRNTYNVMDSHNVPPNSVLESLFSLSYLFGQIMSRHVPLAASSDVAFTGAGAGAGVGVGAGAGTIPNLMETMHQYNMEDDSLSPFWRFTIGFLIFTSVPIIIILIRWILMCTCYKCTHIQQKLSEDDCISILDEYYQRNQMSYNEYVHTSITASQSQKSNTHVATHNGISHYSKQGDNNETFASQHHSRELKEMRESRDKATAMTAVIAAHHLIPKIGNYHPIGSHINNSDTTIPIDHIHSPVPRTRKRKQADHYKKNFKTKIPFVRDNMVKLTFAITSLIASALLITLGLWVFGTDPTMIIAFVGITTTALIFNGGFIDFFKNYVSYLWLLASNKIKVGKLIHIPGMTQGYSCVYRFKPLYVIVLFREVSPNKLNTELAKKHIPNAIFLSSSMDTMRCVEEISKNASLKSVV